MSKQRSLFDRVFGRDFLDGFFGDFGNFFPPEPVHNEDFFSSTKLTYTYPVDEPEVFEYKVVETHKLSNSQGADLETELNKLGAEGWELKVWDGSRAIFIRFAEEDDGEEEESEPQGV